MPKLGRNDPCRCGSGKKYKRCCLPAAELEERAPRQLALAEAEAQWRVEHQRNAAIRAHWPDLLAQAADDYADDAAFVDASNAVVDLIHEGRLDEAETAARALIVDYPFVPDGLERLGHVYETRGDMKTAAKCYRDAVEQTKQLDMEGEHSEWVRQLADRIDPPEMK